ncbi:Cyclic dof factor 3 [Vitis vinifera]|uniref:Cyclic dof factor 3 n=1 Tax=Vitis vinifera TaxID=29760 RepID=A0A438BM81_VITVI|nr:Cyclic dof factor 3 [Vitis vinifera]
MQEPKDPAFKLFGKTIPMLADGDAPVSSVMLETLALLLPVKMVLKKKLRRSGKLVKFWVFDQGFGTPPLQDALGGKPAETKGEDGSEESRNSETVAESNENPKTPSIAEENVTLKTSKAEKGQSDSPDSQEKNPEEARQNPSMPRSARGIGLLGVTMRNVPVGAGRRKNKNSASHYRHITISEALQTVRIEATNGVHQPTLKSNGTVLTFGSDAPFCDSMTSVLNLEEKKMPNGARNGFHTHEEQGIPVSFRVQENGDDHSSASSITVSNSSEEGSKYGLHEAKRNSHGVPSRIPCIPGIPWPYPWNSAVPPPFCLQRSSERCLWVPKTLRIDDPAEAAKSSIWTTLGIKNDKVDSVSGGGLFNAFHLKGDDKNHAIDTSAVLRANLQPCLVTQLPRELLIES